MQHHGLAAMLLGEVIRYATSHDLMISLETHNPDNVPLAYEHLGSRSWSGPEAFFIEAVLPYKEVQAFHPRES